MANTAASEWRGANPTELHRKLSCLTAGIRAAFREVLHRRELSTISLRMKRAALMEALYDAAADLARLSLFCSGAEFLNPHQIALSALTETVASVFKSWTLGSDATSIAAQYADCKRIIVEGKIMFQQLNVFHGATFVQDTIWAGIVAKIAAIPNYGLQQMIVGTALADLPKCRVLRGAGELRELQRLCNDIKESCAFAVALLPTTEQKRMLPQLLRIPYTEAVSEQLKGALPMNDVDTFLQAVSSLLDDEYQLAMQCIPDDATTPDAVKLKLQTALLLDKTEDIIEDTTSGIASTLMYPNLKPERFRVLLNVFDFLPSAVSKIRAAFAAAATGFDLSTVDITKLALIYRTFRAFLHAATPQQHHHVFLRSLNDTFSLKLDPSRLASAIAEQLDRLVRVQASTEIDDVCSLVALCRQRDLFLDHYKQLLARRILVSKHPNFAVEEYTAKKLSPYLGREVEALFVMLYETVVRRDKPFALCNEGIWPPSPGAQAFPGSCLAKLQHDVEQRVAMLTAADQSATPANPAFGHLRMTLNPWLTRADVTVRVGNDHFVRVSGALPQIAALQCIFQAHDEGKPVALAQLADALGLDTMLAFCVASSLEPSGLVVHTEKKFVANVDTVRELHQKKLQLPFIPTRPKESKDLAAQPVDKTAMLTTTVARPSKVDEVTVAEVLQQAKDKKAEGNTAFKDENFAVASQCYHEALDLLSSIPSTQEVEVARVSIQSNSAFALLKLSRFREVKEVATAALANPHLTKELEPKLRYRRGVALLELADVEGAYKDLSAAHKLTVKWDSALAEKLAQVMALRRKGK